MKESEGCQLCGRTARAPCAEYDAPRQVHRALREEDGKKRGRGVREEGGGGEGLRERADLPRAHSARTTLEIPLDVWSEGGRRVRERGSE